MVEKTIPLRFTGRYDEAPAGGTLKPGHLLDYQTDGDVVVHAAAGGNTPVMVAFEDALQGRTVATAYSATERVFFGHPNSSDVVGMYLKAGENVAVGETLISAGDGTLIAESSAASAGVVKKIIGVVAPTNAATDLDLSASGAVDTLIHVAIL